VKESMYTPSCTLNVDFTYQFEGEEYTTSVPGDQEHAKLAAGLRRFQNTYRSLYHKAGSENLRKTNLLNASIGLLYTDAPLDEGDPGDFEFASYSYRLMDIKNQYLFNTMDFYKPETTYMQTGVYSSKAKRDSTFNEQLTRHIANARLDDIVESYADKTDINKQIASSQFHEHYHHTEQGLMFSLQRQESMNWISSLIKKQKNMNALGALFLDVHTVRPMCACCNVGVIGFQNSDENGFLANLTKLTSGTDEDDFSLQTPDHGIMMRTRVGCTQHASRDAKGLHLELDNSLVNITKPTRSKVTFQYSRPRQVVQAYVDQGIHDAIITNEKYHEIVWKEDIFSSHELPQNRYNQHMKKNARKG
jgi:hypothetical protein